MHQSLSARTKNQTQSRAPSDSSADTKLKNIIHETRKRQARRRQRLRSRDKFNTLTFQERSWGRVEVNFRRTATRYESAYDSGSDPPSKPGMPSARSSRRKPAMRHRA